MKDFHIEAIIKIEQILNAIEFDDNAKEFAYEVGLKIFETVILRLIAELPKDREQDFLDRISEGPSDEFVEKFKKEFDETKITDAYNTVFKTVMHAYLTHLKNLLTDDQFEKAEEIIQSTIFKIKE